MNKEVLIMLEGRTTVYKNNVLAALTVMLLFYSFFVTINYAFNFGIVVLPHWSVVYLPIPFIFILLFCFFSNKRIFIKSKSAIPIVFGIYVFVSILISYCVTPFNTRFVEACFNSLTWLTIFLIPFFLRISSKTIRCIGYFSAASSILFGFIYCVYITRIPFTNELRALAVNSIYYLLLLVPFVLSVDKKWIKWPTLICSFFIIVISGKATTLIAFILGILVYLYLSFKGKKRIVFISVTILFLIVAFAFFRDKILSLEVAGKISSMNETGLVNRIPIYQSIFEKYESLQFFNKLFGAGYNGVYNAIGSSAHNDFLEVLFDYGLFGLLLYILMIFGFIRNAFVLIKRNSDYSAAFVAALAIFIVCSLTSELIFIPRYFFFLAFFLSSIINLGGDKK